MILFLEAGESGLPWRKQHVHNHVHDGMEHLYRHYHESDHCAHDYQEQNPPEILEIFHLCSHKHDEIGYVTPMLWT